MTDHIPMWLLAEVTYACPLQCPYCSNPLQLPASRKQELSTDEWISVMRQARELGAVQLGFSAMTVSDDETLTTIRQAFTADPSYLLDPHGAVAVAAARKVSSRYPARARMVCLATAHPAKFDQAVREAIGQAQSEPQARESEGDEGQPNAYRCPRCQQGRLQVVAILTPRGTFIRWPGSPRAPNRAH